MRWIIDWIAGIAEASRKKTYKIIHDPEFGYIPAHYGFYWQAIDENGFACTSVDGASKWPRPDLWVETAEEAGRRINLHATNRGRTEVWSA